MQTSFGEIKIRNKFDEEVIKEVIEERAYEHWGELKLEGTVLDCGADFGAFSFLALAQPEVKKVISVEPNPNSYKLLVQNTPNAIHIEKAISNKEFVYISDNKERPELNMISDSGLIVGTTTLDKLITEPIDFLKMDIEGAEYEAFYSCTKLDLVKQISIEYHNGGTEMAKLLIYLESLGFKMKWIGGGVWGHLQLSK